MAETSINLRQMLLYKLDRTIAIVGLCVLGTWALSIATNESLQVSVAVVGALAGYIGGRSGKEGASAPKP
jgi:hypothetical protein